jgi:hypothetical protein
MIYILLVNGIVKTIENLTTYKKKKFHLNFGFEKAGSLHVIFGFFLQKAIV